MGLCGSFRCGCGVTTDGSIDISGSGEPGDPYVLGLASGWEDGTYTPTLSGMAIGTGGSAANSAAYAWSGDGIGVGSLLVTGRLVFGSSGPTFPGATVTVTLPTGFQFDPTNMNARSIVGGCMFIDAGSVDCTGHLVWASATTARLMVDQVGSTYAISAATSTTVPFTWVAGDGIEWSITARAVKV